MLDNSPIAPTLRPLLATPGEGGAVVVISAILGSRGSVVRLSQVGRCLTRVSVAGNLQETRFQSNSGGSAAHAHPPPRCGWRRLGRRGHRRAPGLLRTP